MKNLLFAAIFLLPAGLAAAPACAEQRESQEAKEQLKKEAVSLEAQLRASPGNIELYMKLGFTYSRLEQADDAQRAFESAVSLDPKKAEAHYMLGLIYEKKGLRDRALTAWKACMDNTTDPRMSNTAKRHIHHLSHQ